jgi:pyruvate formate lyase activating enzyme
MYGVEQEQQEREQQDHVRCPPVAGIQKLTTIDYPGHLAAVFFFGGCPWNCRFCHNTALRDGTAAGAYSRRECEEFLEKRRDFLEGIVVSGGEPTALPELPDILRWIRSFGYKTALHTNGFNPEMLQQVIQAGLVDYIGMDVKGPPKAYDRITRASHSCLPVARSMDIIASSSIDYEFRTTYHPDILSESELMETMHAVARKSPRRYYIQMFHAEGVNDERLAGSGDIVTVPASLIMLGEKLFREFGVR